MKTLKALLVNGSPGAKGCTFTALTELKKTLEDEELSAWPGKVLDFRRRKQRFSPVFTDKQGRNPGASITQSRRGSFIP